MSLGTLADDTVITGAGTAFGRDVYIVSSDIAVSHKGNTAGEGPLEFGIAHGNLGITEIKDKVNVSGFDPDDISERLDSMIPAKTMGSFTPNTANGDPLINDGQMKRVKTRMSIGSAQALSYWVMNRSGTALTTGGKVTFTAKHYYKIR